MVVCSTVDPDVRLWLMDLERGTSEALACDPRAIDARISPDGRWAACGIWHGEGGEVWDLHTRQRVADLNLQGGGFVAFSHDNRWLATVDGAELCLWEAGSWKLVRRAHMDFGVILEFSPDNSMLALQHEGSKVRLIDVATFDEVAVLEPPDAIQGHTVAFSPDGRRLAAFTNAGHIVRVWDLQALNESLSAIRLGWQSAAQKLAE